LALSKKKREDKSMSSKINDKIVLCDQ